MKCRKRARVHLVKIGKTTGEGPTGSRDRQGPKYSLREKKKKKQSANTDGGNERGVVKHQFGYVIEGHRTIKTGIIGRWNSYRWPRKIGKLEKGKMCNDCLTFSEGNNLQRKHVYHENP